MPAAQLPAFRATAPAQTQPGHCPGALRHRGEPSGSCGCSRCPRQGGCPDPGVGWSEAAASVLCPCFPTQNLPGEPEEPTPSPGTGWASRGVPGLGGKSPWWPRGQLSPGPSSLFPPHFPGLLQALLPFPHVPTPSWCPPLPARPWTAHPPSLPSSAAGKEPSFPPLGMLELPPGPRAAAPRPRPGAPGPDSDKAAPTGVGGWGKHRETPAGASRDVRRVLVLPQGRTHLSEPGAPVCPCPCQPHRWEPHGKPPWLLVPGAGRHHGPHTHGYESWGQ